MEFLLEIALNAVFDKKAINPVVLDMRNLFGVADYFLICSGKTQIQVRAIADQILEKAAECGFQLPKKEGYRDGIWILLDFGLLVVHILQEREREFYALEQLWHDATVLDIPSLISG